MIETRKVSYLPSDTNYDIPIIKLTGKWLKEIGFNVGDTIQLIKDQNIIILMKTNNQIIELKNKLNKN